MVKFFNIKKFLFFFLILFFSVSANAMQRSKRIKNVSPEVASSLQEAIEEESLEIFKVALREGADPKAKDEQGNNALHLVSQKGLDKFIVPLKEHVYVNAKNVDGETALMLAVKNNHANCVQKLLSLYASVKVCNKDDKNACDLAAQNGHFECLEHILFESDVAPKDKDKALFLAVKNNHESCMNLLLNLGARPNKVVEMAIIGGENNCIMPLLMKGANVREAFLCAVKNKNSYLTDLFLSDFENVGDQVKQFLISSRPVIEKAQEAALTIASINGNLPIFKEFLPKISNQRLKEISLINSCLFGHLECVDGFLKSDINPNFLDDGTELTPLLAAIVKNGGPELKSESCEIVELLLEFKADPNMTNALGCTPLMQAAASGCSRCVNLLLLEKANPNLINNIRENTSAQNVLKIFENFDQEMIGATALILAAYHGDIGCVAALLNGGADLTLKNSRGNTALDVALQKNHIPCVRLLSQRSSQEENTFALCIAAQEGLTGCAQELLTSGAIASDDSLVLAVMSKKVPCVELLLNARANPNLKYLVQDVYPNSSNVTNLVFSLLQIAAMSGNDEILRLLFKAGAKDDINNIKSTSLSAAAMAGNSNCIETILEAENHLGLSREQRLRRHLFALQQAIKDGRKDFIFTFLLDVNLADLAAKYPAQPLPHDQQLLIKRKFLQTLSALAARSGHHDLAEIFLDSIKFDQELEEAAKRVRLARLTTENDEEREKFRNLTQILQARQLGLNQKRKGWNLKKVIDNGIDRRKKRTRS